MPALASEPFRGVAIARAVDTVGGAHRISATVSITDVVASTVGADVADWEGTPGLAVTLRYECTVTNFVGPDNLREVRIKVPGGADVGATVWNPATTPNQTTTVETRTFHFDDDPLNQALGAIRAGMIELYVRIKSTDAVNAYDIDSRGGFATVPATQEARWARGYLRSRSTLSSFAISNASLGGAEPATFAFPDTTFNRLGLDAALYRAEAVTLEHFKSGPTTIRTKADAAATATQRDYTFSTESGNDGIVLTDYPTGSAGVRAILPVRDFGGDNETAWASTGHATGFTLTDSGASGSANRTLEHSTRIPVNPTISVQALTRTTGPAVANFGIHTLGGTFRVENARSENISGSNAKLNATSLNADATTGRSLGTDLTPTTNVYTIPGFTYSGPTAKANRGTGPNGDKAAHTLTGDAKKIRVQMVAPAGGTTNRPTVDSTTSPWALSDLYRLDSHPQRSATFNDCTDPLGATNDGEDPTYIIAVHALRAWAYVGDVNGLPVNGVVVGFQQIDPDNVKTSSNTDSTRTTGSTGYTPSGNPVGMDVKAPGGTWKIRAYTDITGQSGSSMNTNGNYGDGNTDQTDGAHVYRGFKDQSIEYLSPYSADKLLYVGFGRQVNEGAGNHAVRGEAAIVGCALSVDDVLTDPDAGTTPEAALSRFNTATGQAEHYDEPTNTWIAGNVPRFMALSQSAGNPKVWIKTFSGTNTATWPAGGIFCTTRVTYQGAYFQSQTMQTLTDPKDADAHHITRNIAADVAFDQSLIFGW